MNEVQRSLGIIEGKLDQVLDHGPRIRSLERWRAWTTGVAVALAAVVSIAWKLVTKHG